MTLAWTTNGEGWTDEQTPRRYVRVVEPDTEGFEYEVARVFVDDGDMDMEKNLRAILAAGQIDLESADFFEAMRFKIESWGLDRGLGRLNQDGAAVVDMGMARAQLLKCMAELGELADAVLKNNRTDMMDGLGDTLVTLILFAMNAGFSIRGSLQAAWDEIKDRKGKTENGTFVKEGDNGNG
ncbi:MAG: hypothetical protein EBT03_08055 [Betaproteobacteria bacterium]|nr:hypothetical protein [Betaproteobacteria bacterium]